jgi:molybdopterin-binding protein
MSHLIAKVQKIQSVQNLNILSFTCNDTTLKMMSLDLNDTISKDAQVMLTCKPTAIAIGKNIQGQLSYANQLHVTITSLEVGELLCALKLQFGAFVLESIITTDSQKRMQLQEGDAVIALIKSSDLSIAKVLS